VQKTTWLVTLGMLIVLGVPRAEAQVINWDDRAFFNVSLGYQTQSHDFDSTKTFPLYGETAILKAGHEIGSGALLDLSGGARVWRNVGIGIGYSRFQNTDDILVEASLPHPVFVDRPRQVSVPATGLEHTESAIHLFGLWMLPVSDKMDVAIFLGPTFFSVKQDLVTDLQIPQPESPPYAGMVTGVIKNTADDNAVGLNLGIDVSYMVTSQFGGGIFLRYSGTSTDLSAAGQEVSMDVGGFQFGLGLRVRFQQLWFQ
jgi:opacity protein-like surface antigen